MKNVIITFCTLLFVFSSVNAQVLYVDSQNGNDGNNGDINMPFKTIHKAVAVANNLTGQGNITLKILPGLYVLYGRIDINPVRILDENSKFTIESALKPGDASWTPSKMPVIVSVSENNSETQFKHSTGFLVSSDFVEISGLKFCGNANPSVVYYYPITRENPELRNLKVSQCIFVGDKNAGIIQGGIWAHGTEININHNVFYQCRNAVLLFQNINNSVITNNIIYDAYESAFWMGDDKNLKFENNVVANCNYFWVGNAGSKINYKLTNSVISGNNHFAGNWENGGIVENNMQFVETNINTKDKIVLVERDSEEIPKTHLHIMPNSPGYDLKAGIFE